MGMALKLFLTFSGTSAITIHLHHCEWPIEPFLHSQFRLVFRPQSFQIESARSVIARRLLRLRLLMFWVDGMRGGINYIRHVDL